MPKEKRMLTHQQAISFSNHLGAKQDEQACFEALATRELIAHATFEKTQVVTRFGGPSKVVVTSKQSGKIEDLPKGEEERNRSCVC